MLAASDNSSGRSLNLAEWTSAPSIAYISAVTTMNANGTRATREFRGDGCATRAVIESVESARSYGGAGRRRWTRRLHETYESSSVYTSRTASVHGACCIVRR